METLSKTLEEAQRAVLSVQGDLVTLRVQLEDAEDSDSRSKALMNPFYAELQDAVQEKQQVAADLLQKSAHHLFQVYRQVEARAQRLTHIQDKEKEVSSAKKTMRRYLESQVTAQEAVTEELNDAFQLEAMKVDHLETTAASFVSATSQRALQRRVLHAWLKRAMVRVFTREQTATQRGGVDNVDIMAQRYTLHRLTERRKRKALHQWERCMHRHRLAASRKEAAEMRASAEFFQTELAKTQKLMSNQLDEVMTHARQATEHKTSECDLLSDEVHRLKVALEDVTSEFGDRTRTYVRQQEEADLFFKRKEEHMNASIHELQDALDTLRYENEKLKRESQLLTSSALDHAKFASESMVDIVLRKSDLYASVVSEYCRRLKQGNLSLQDEIRQLRSTVTLLAPLSEKMLHVENQLAESTQSLSQEKAKTHALEKDQKQIRGVLTLLTERVHISESRQVRQAYWHQWKCRAERNLRDDLEVQVRELTQHIKDSQAEALRQRQHAEAEYREQKERLSVALEDRDRVYQALEQDGARDKAMLASLDQQLYDVNVDNANLSAKLTRSQQQEQALTCQLSDMKVALVKAQEAQERSALTQQEATYRSTLALREMALVQVWGASNARDLDQAIVVCESWQTHCSTQEAAFLDSQAHTCDSAATALEAAELRRSTALSFATWRHWARHQRLRRTHAAEHQRVQDAADAVVAVLQAQHAIKLDALTSQLNAATKEHARQITELQAARDEEAERLERQLRELQHVQLDLEAQLEAERDARLSERTLAEKQSQENAAVHATAMREAASKMDAALRQMHDRFESSADTARHAHRQELLKLRLEAEAARALLVSNHDTEREAVGRVHAQTVAQLATELESSQQEVRQLGRTVVEYCARSSFSAWRAWAQERQHDRLVGQMKPFITNTTDFVTNRFNLLEAARAVQQETFSSAVVALLRDMREAHREHRQAAEAHKDRMVQHIASLKTDADSHELAARVAEAQAEQLRSTLHETVKANNATLSALERSEAEREQLAEQLAATQRALEEAKEAEKVCRAQCEERCTRAACQLAVERDVLQLEHDYTNTVCYEYTLHHEAVIADVRAAWRDEVERRCAAEVELSTFCSDEEPSQVDTAVSTLTTSVQNWVVQLTQATQQLRTSSAASGATAPDEATGARNAVECVVMSLAKPVWAPALETDGHTGENSHDEVPTHAAAVNEMQRAVEVVRASASQALAEAHRYYDTRVGALETLLDAAQQAQADLRDSMDDLLAENRALAADMKSTAAMTTAPRDADARTCSDVWGERLDQLALRYQRVLDAMHNSIQERRDTFYSVNGMLVEVDTFSEELLRRFEENVKALQALQSQLHPHAGSSLASHHSAETENSDGVTSPVPAAPRSPRQCPTDPFTPSPMKLDLAEFATQPSDSPLPPPHEGTAVATAVTLPSRQYSSGRSSSRTSSNGREQLVDRVHLLEKLLVQTKVQLAQARAMAEDAAASVPVSALSSVDQQTWTERATRDIEELHIPLTESQMVPLYLADPEAMVVCMDTLRGRMQEQANKLLQQEEVLESRVRAAESQRDTQVRQLSQAMQAQHQRHMEEQKQLLASLQAAEDTARAQASEADATLQAVKNNYEQELAQLEAEVDREQAELERVRAAHRSALEDQKNMWEMQRAQLAQSYDRQIRQLERERDRESLQCQRMEAEQQAHALAHKNALARLQAEHVKALDALESRYSRYYIEQEQVHAVAEHTRSTHPLARAHVHAESDFASYLEARETLIWHASEAKMTEVMEAAVRCGDEIGRRRSEQRSQAEREEWETETMQLRERLARFEEKAAAADSAVTKSLSTSDELPAESPAMPPPVKTRSPSHVPGPSETSCSESPPALTASCSPASRERAVEAPRAAALHKDGRRDAGSCPPSAADATSLESPPQSSVLSPHIREPASTTPLRARGHSLDSLDLSQSLLRYSKMLSDQTDRNQERLQNAAELEAEVNDLIDRGTRLAEMAERTGLTPRRHR